MPQGIGPGVPSVRPLFRSLLAPASGLSAQRQRLDAIASNIANAETTRTENGGPYRRQVVSTEPAALLPPGTPAIVAGRVPGSMVRAGELPPPAGDAAVGVRVAEVVEAAGEGPMIYDPGHPDADESGYVRMPNVRITDELVEMMEARRMYEANASVFEAMKGMLRRALEIRG